MLETIPTIESPKKARCVYVLPIGDIHAGSLDFSRDSERKLNGYIDWVESNKDSFVFLMGDLWDLATRHSKTNPHMATMNLNQAKQWTKKKFWPIRKQIAGAIDGNHDLRLVDHAGYNPLEEWCDVMGIQHYGASVVMRFNVCGTSGRTGSTCGGRCSYLAYYHHTTAGGTTMGGKVNRVVKLSEIVEGCDLYCGAHNHALSVSFNRIWRPSLVSGQIKLQKRAFVLTGGYVDWSRSYAEAKMLTPSKLGSPRIRLDGGQNKYHTKDIHVSL
jgi:hypothetical protein